MSRFQKPSDTLTASQRSLVHGLGESYIKPANAVPHRLIVGPMKAPGYKPPEWVAPIR
jgi:hypothetical protein